MSTHKNIGVICVIATLLTVALTVLFINGQALGLTPVAGEASGMFTANDLNADWDTSPAARIQLSDDGSTISGNGAYSRDGNVYIAYPGYYVLTGALTDGSVIVDAGKNDKIWLLLDGVALHCSDGAAIRIEQAGKVFLTLADGTENTVSSGGTYSEDVASAGVDGAIYSRDDLTVNGSGALTVRADYKHGIVCNDDLAITGGTITVNAAQDGIHANDSVRIRETAISISAGDDGITVSNDDETAFLYMESGSVTIPACYEGLEAIDITIAGGTIDITATDDGINANGSGAGSVIRITGGDITITNPSGRDGDGLDSNGSIYVEGGRLFISVSGSGGSCALDCGVENGGECVVSGGTVIACGGAAMAEGFDASSPQGFLMYSTTAAAGTALSLTGPDGQELLSAEIPCDFSSAVLSAPGLRVGDVCTITIGGIQEEVTIDNAAVSGFGPAGMFGHSFGDGPDGGPPEGPKDRPGEDAADGPPSDDRKHPGDGEFPGNGEFPGDGEFPGKGELPENMGPPDEMDGPSDRRRPEGGGPEGPAASG